MVGIQEVPGNLDFKDGQFREYMRAVGWRKGEAWCAYFGELVWSLAYQVQDSTIYAQVSKLFNAGAVATYNNFSHSAFTVSKTPRVGALAVWQHYYKGVPSWKGHLGIVNKFDNRYVSTIDGNTNPAGGSEGFEVWPKTRPLVFKTTGTEMILKGFVYPKKTDYPLR